MCIYCKIRNNQTYKKEIKSERQTDSLLSFLNCALEKVIKNYTGRSWINRKSRQDLSETQARETHNRLAFADGLALNMRVRASAHRWNYKVSLEKRQNTSPTSIKPPMNCSRNRRAKPREANSFQHLGEWLEPNLFQCG